MCNFKNPTSIFTFQGYYLHLRKYKLSNSLHCFQKLIFICTVLGSVDKYLHFLCIHVKNQATNLTRWQFKVNITYVTFNLSNNSTKQWFIGWPKVFTFEEKIPPTLKFLRLMQIDDLEGIMLSFTCYITYTVKSWRSKVTPSATLSLKNLTKFDIYI